MFPLIQGCKTLTRAEVEAIAWSNNGPLPAELCEQFPELWDYGFYRTKDTGGYDFLPWCDGETPKYVTFKEQDLLELIDATVPKGLTEGKQD